MWCLLTAHWGVCAPSWGIWVGFWDYVINRIWRKLPFAIFQVQALRNRWIPVMVNDMYRMDWITEYPDIWLNTISGYLCERVSG